MSEIKNILFVMADQLRADYLSCYGHPHLQTPAMDALAQRGVRFTNAYVQAPICGPSRMSTYTGRYVASHGSSYNGVPLRVGEMTMGDHLRPLGLRTALVGKTHMAADVAGMKRLGVSRDTIEGVFAAECGFEPYERDDGIHPDKANPQELAYNKYLRSLGYDTENPWHQNANASKSEKGELLSGWLMRNATFPADVAEEHSETAYMTDRAMDFIGEAGDQPWCLHLSYIKPHWPYIAPAPYHDMFGPEHVLPPNRSDSERVDPHPVIAAFMQHEESQSFSSDEVRNAVIPAYMGLIRQVDDHLARLWAFLEERGLWENTMVVVTSDHGDYLGDHWLGEKQLFHEESARIPLIVYDPRPEADATRGKVDAALVESIDLAPTFVEAVGGDVPSHILEGRSLIDRLHANETPWRDAVFSECDYAFRRARRKLGTPISGSHAWMVRTDDWKYIHYEGERPQLFNLKADPRELVDLGKSSEHWDIRTEMHERLFEWLSTRKMRITMGDDAVEARTEGHEAMGIRIGTW